MSYLLVIIHQRPFKSQGGVAHTPFLGLFYKDFEGLLPNMRRAGLAMKIDE